MSTCLQEEALAIDGHTDTSRMRGTKGVSRAHNRPLHPCVTFWLSADCDEVGEGLGGIGDIGPTCLERRDDLLLVATGVAAHQHFAAVGVFDGQARLPILVCRAPCHPLCAGLPTTKCLGDGLISAVAAGLAARTLLVRLLGAVHLDCRELLYPGTQVACEHKGAATTFHGAQLAQLNCCIESRPAGARDRARLGDGVGQRCIHLHLAIVGPGWSRQPCPRHLGRWRSK